GQEAGGELADDDLGGGQVGGEQLQQVAVGSVPADGPGGQRGGDERDEQDLGGDAGGEKGFADAGLLPVGRGRRRAGADGGRAGVEPLDEEDGEQHGDGEGAQRVSLPAPGGGHAFEGEDGAEQPPVRRHGRRPMS